MTDKPKYIRTLHLPIHKISLDANLSGWRPPSKKRIATLKQVFMEGGFGQSVTCNVSVLTSADSNDGALIDDGYSTVKALSECYEAFQKNEFTPDKELNDIFTTGLLVIMFEYSDNLNMRVRRAWNAGKHDEESNTVRWSSPGQKIRIASDYFAETGNWTQTIVELKTRFNFSDSKVRSPYPRNEI